MDPIDHLLFALEQNPDFMELKESDFFQIDLKYAQLDNFAHKNVYGKFNRAFLHQRAAEQLLQSALLLKKHDPSLKFCIYDALRPARFQWILWEVVAGTPQEAYLADPRLGSIHSYGFAVDLTILDSQHQPLDMGTPFDDFTPLAEPQLEGELLQAGKLTSQQIENRALLREILRSTGFLSIPNEWWHFNGLLSAEVRRNYQIIE